MSIFHLNKSEWGAGPLLHNVLLISVIFCSYLETNPNGNPKPTKLLEILSECNWEPHRNLVLSTLFRRMNSDLLAEPFCLGLYKIKLLSTTVKGVDRSCTITYKVCISLLDKTKKTKDLQSAVEKTKNKCLKTKPPKTRTTQVQKGNRVSDHIENIVVNIKHSLYGFMKQ